MASSEQNSVGKPNLLDLQDEGGWPSLSGTTPPPPDDGPLPAEFDTCVLERTAQLQKVIGELEAFSYSVAHDLTAPLVQIRGYVGVLNKRCGAQFDDVAQNYLHLIESCADRMCRSTLNLLRLAQVSRTELRRDRVDVSRIAREIAASLSTRAPGRQIEWVIADGLEAEGDTGLIDILLDNLLTNAWKYTSNCPLARIEFGASRQARGGVAFEVRDNGVGFDMASASRLFQPFERLHTRAEFPGSGIGLATARRIVQRHGGRIWAEAAVGQGAIFRFTLGPPASPLAQEKWS